MDTPHPDRMLHIDLDLTIHDEEVHGRATVEGRRQREFEGWLGLIAALDALVDTAAERAD